MASCIITENFESVLSCHQGLSNQEITYDCLEKAKALAQVGYSYLADSSSPLPAAYMSVLEDWLEVGLKHCRLIGASKQIVILKS